MTAATAHSDQPGLRAQKKRDTRRRLMHAARQLLAEQGQFTADQFAAHAGVSRATYFNYFPGKNDLLRALYVDHMDLLAVGVDALLARDLDTESRIVGVFGDFAKGVKEHGEYLRAVTAEFESTFAAPHVSAEHTEMFNTQMIRVLEAGLANGEVRTDLSPRFLAQMIAAVYVSTIRYWRQEPDVDFVDTFLRAGRFVAGSITSATQRQG